MPSTSHTRKRLRKTRAELAGLVPNESTPLWAHQPPQDLGPLPSHRSTDIDRVEVHPLPTRPLGLIPIVINGISIERAIRSYRTFGSNGIQYVLEEGPQLFARYRLVPSSKLGYIKPDASLQRVQALPRAKAGDKIPEVEGIFAVAFRDPNNEGPAYLMKKPNTQVIIGVQWAGGAVSWELKSAASKFLKGQAAHFLYDIATRSEKKFSNYVASLSLQLPPPPPPECEDSEVPQAEDPKSTKSTKNPEDPDDQDHTPHRPHERIPILLVHYVVHLRFIILIICLYFPYLAK